MKYFSKINSLAELKKLYRKLAIENHPDKGRTTEAMQQINLEFEKLFAIWKEDTRTVEAATGYESDYAGASAREYTDYVYNEYSYRGSNYKGQSPEEVVDILRIWLKETYPRYKFSVTRKHYDSIYVYLIRVDFEAFSKDSKCKCSKQLNHYHIGKDTDLTDRAREVMDNVYCFVNSYNFDDSDAMTDYFHCNFYLNIGIGTWEKPYKMEIPKLQAKKGTLPPVFKHPEGTAHKAIRQALGKARFSSIESKKYSGVLLDAMRLLPCYFSISFSFYSFPFNFFINMEKAGKSSLNNSESLFLSITPLKSLSPNANSLASCSLLKCELFFANSIILNKSS